MNPSHFRGRRALRWASRLLAMSVPIAALLASCGGDDAGGLFETGAGGRSTTSSTSTGAGGATSGAAGDGASTTTASTTSTTTAGGSTSAGGGSGTAGGAGGQAGSGVRDAGGDVSSGGGGGAGGAAGGGGQGGGGRDASTDGPCIAQENESCGGFVIGACRCAVGLICRAGIIPDAPGTCVKPDGGTPRSCLPMCNLCVSGICCGATCCGAGEWCDQSSGLPTCKCGNQAACVRPQPLGPSSENRCGDVCCSGGNCPQ